MNKTRFRRLVYTLAVTAGLVAINADPASAGINLSNHCEPLHTIW